jgi:hypothetical protein
MGSRPDGPAAPTGLAWHLVSCRADYTAGEWRALRHAPTYAGQIISTAEHGRAFWQTLSLSLARAFEDARAEAPHSELVDDIVADRPHVGRLRVRSSDDARDHAVKRLRAAVAIVEKKGDARDAGAYARFALEVAETVARAYPASGLPASPAEEEVLAGIAQGLGLRRRN